ncbi:AhpD-like protein [Xylogone sp. PMI_703]|nr:AhpD-like protein [Xylogone sp. PMI_703]
MSADELAKIHKTLFEVGIAERRKVVGDAYVDRALAGGSSEFAQPMQQLVTEFCWGSVWTRPGLERKQRSLINIGMLCALNRGPELGNHIRGAIRNGLTELEIREAILQVSVYCGMPAGLEGFKIAERVIEDMIEKGEYKRS